MQCPECQSANPADAGFCNKCGSKLKMVCPNCNNTNPPGSNFCNGCGHNLSKKDVPQKPRKSLPIIPAEPKTPESISVPEGERRQATVVFADLSGYTSMNEILDPEEVEAIVSRIKQEAVLSQSLEHLMPPDTVQSVIRARLDRLDHFSRESMRLASVIGREFAQRILEQISSSRERLSRSLEELKVLEMIQQIRVLPEAEYMFKHIITQEVTYETSGAVVLAARTKYYRADMLARKEEIESGHSLLGEIQRQFQNWGIPAWQLKCEQALKTMGRA